MSSWGANPLQLAFKINQRYILRVTAFNYKSFQFLLLVQLVFFHSALAAFRVGRVWRLFNCPRPSERLCIGVCGYTMLESRFDSYANRVFLLSAWSACCGLLVISQLALATKSFLIIPKSRCVDARDWLVKPTHGLRPNIVWYELCICVSQCVCVRRTNCRQCCDCAAVVDLRNGGWVMTFCA